MFRGNELTAFDLIEIFEPLRFESESIELDFNEIIDKLWSECGLTEFDFIEVTDIVLDCKTTFSSYNMQRYNLLISYLSKTDCEINVWFLLNKIYGRRG